MSYVRFGPDSDVYAFGHVDGHEQLWINRPDGATGERYDSLDALEARLRELEGEGFKVPPSAYRQEDDRG